MNVKGTINASRLSSLFSFLRNGLFRLTVMMAPTGQTKNVHIMEGMF